MGSYRVSNNEKQVGNEGEILQRLGRDTRLRVHVFGIDVAIGRNATAVRSPMNQKHSRSYSTRDFSANISMLPLSYC